MCVHAVNPMHDGVRIVCPRYVLCAMRSSCPLDLQPGAMGHHEPCDRFVSRSFGGRGQTVARINRIVLRLYSA